MLNLGDALVTLAAFFALLWLFWQFSEATALATKMMERQVGQHNFRRPNFRHTALISPLAGKLRLRIALAFTL